MLLLSPVGAPLIGGIVIEACGEAWEVEAARCDLQHPVIVYFMGSNELPFVMVGPLFAIIWYALALAILLALLGTLARIVWGLTMERL